MSAPRRRALGAHGRVAVLPPRLRPSVAGLVCASNMVLHSGLDDANGHFVAAYGIDAEESIDCADGAA